MGYMGLNSWVDSDRASDLSDDAIDAMLPVLEKGLKEKANGWNTEGCVNVALFIEAFKGSDFGNVIFMTERWRKLINKTIECLNKKIGVSKHIKWEDEGNKLMHIKAYQRMVRNLNKILKDE
jgi:hypothetical protein